MPDTLVLASTVLVLGIMVIFQPGQFCVTPGDFGLCLTFLFQSGFSSTAQRGKQGCCLLPLSGSRSLTPHWAPWTLEAGGAWLLP